MDLKISMFDTLSAPSWVTQTKPEPSNVSSCTPSTKKNRAPQRIELVGDSPGVSTRLFPTSAVKASLVRERSDTTLTQDMSHSSISSNLFSNGSAGQVKSPSLKGERDSLSNKQSNRQSPRSATSSPRQPVTSPAVAKQIPGVRGSASSVPRYVAPTGVASPALPAPRSSASITPGLSYRNVANGAAMTSGNGFIPLSNALSLSYAYPVAAPGMQPVFASAGQMGEGPAPLVYSSEIGTQEYPGLPGAVPIQGSVLRPMPFPSMPAQQPPSPLRHPVVPPMHGAGHSPPKRVRKDVASTTATNGGGGSSSSSLDGTNQNGQRRKK